MIRSTVCILLMVFTACSRWHVAVPVSSTPLPADTSFIDLEPGWRLRAIVPLWKRGTTDHQFAAQDSDEKTGTVTLRANDNFLGYETQYYVLRKHWGLLQVHLDGATETKNGVTSPLAGPSINLFAIPAGTKRVRLVFLERASQADHNMAVLATNHESALNEATRTIQSDPASCARPAPNYCSWIPPGVALRPEMPVQTTDGISWQPAR